MAARPRAVHLPLSAARPDLLGWVPRAWELPPDVHAVAWWELFPRAHCCVGSPGERWFLWAVWEGPRVAKLVCMWGGPDLMG